MYDRFRLLPLLLIPAWIVFRTLTLLLRPGVRLRTTPAHEVGVGVFGGYLYALGLFTINFLRILQGQFEPASNYNLHLLAGIKDIVASGSVFYIALNLLGNVVLFVPFGFLLPLLWRSWRGGLQVILAGAACSGGIELLQFFTGRGADVDDILLNTFGALVGYLGFLIFRRCAPSVAATFRLRPAQQNQKKQTATPPIKRPRRAVAARYTVGLATCIVLSGGVLLYRVLPFQVSANQASPATPLDPVAAQSTSYTLPTENLHLHSENLILLSAEDAKVLYEVKADQKIPPASMTKIMTALLVLEHLDDLSQPVLLREELFSELYAANAATAGFLPGEKVPAIDLLYGVLLPSGAECSVALAEHIAGSEAAFARLMNEKAAQLGLWNTQFVNATGLHHPDHYSTAKDVSQLLLYALENPRFRDIFTTLQHHTASTNLHPEGVDLVSTMLRDAEATRLLQSTILGGKTGYTNEAGQCLASIAQIEGTEFILVSAGATPKDHLTQSLHLEDARAVYGAIRSTQA